MYNIPIMKIIFSLHAVKFCLLLAILYLLLPFPVFAQDQEIVPIQDFRKAQVIRVLEEGEKEVYGNTQPYQLIELKILNGSDEGQIIKLEHGGRFRLKDSQKVVAGETVVLYRSGFNNQVDEYQIIDKYRLDKIIFIVLGFFVLVLAISRLKGLGSILGLIVSFIVIIQFIIPQILQGNDPVMISIIGSSIIMVATLYLAHGFSKKTTVALISTIISLIITGLLAALFVKVANLSGLGDETAAGFTLNPLLQTINLKGLLLGGMIIGTLGVLDDVTTTQTSTIFELKHTDKTLSFTELLKRGFRVGKDHISSVVNTLILAYTGASLPLLLLIVLNPSAQPLWAILNNESIVEEVIRMIGGSTGLVLAVPITTILASYVCTKLIRPSQVKGI